MLGDTKRPVYANKYNTFIENNCVLLSSKDDHIVLKSPIAVALFPLLNGEYLIEDIVQLLSQLFPPSEVYFTLFQLELDGFIVDAETSHQTKHPDFWQNLDRPLSDVAKRLTKRPVNIFLTQGHLSEPLVDALEDFGIQHDSQAEHSVIISDHLDKSLHEILKDSAVRSCLLIDVSSLTLTIGPVIKQGRSGCLTCLQHRLRLNRPALSFLNKQNNGTHTSPRASFPNSVLQIGLNIAALETAKWLTADEPYALENELVRFDLQTLETSRHTFVHRPQCPQCGNPSISRPKGRILLKHHKLISTSTHYRIQSPNETFKRLKHHISPVTGVVRSMNRVDSGQDALLFNYTVGHSSRIRHQSIESLRLGTRDQSGGKGMSDIQAQVSGLCEALERFSAVHDDDSPDICISFAELQNQAVPPADLLLFSKSQYTDRLIWNAQQNGHFQLVPEPYDEHEAIDWTEAWSLTKDTPCLIPSSYCFYGYEGRGNKYCKADSNGLAAGNTIEEAILQGLFELIERDAVAIWWYNQLRRPSVNLSSFQIPYLDAIQAHYKTIGRELWLLDLTHDLNVPVFVAISRKVQDGPEDILMGFGAHVDAKTAAIRAVLEVNQSLPAVLRTDTERKQQLLPDFADVLDWWNAAKIEDHAYLNASTEEDIKRSEAYPRLDELDPGSVIKTLVHKLSSVGVETLVVDLSRPDIELSVARVIAPGLRHFWRRLAPGRLYTVPVKMGWNTEMLKESQMNPISLFL